MRAAIVLVFALALAGCNSQTVKFSKPCGVIEDSLNGVTATTRDGNERLAVHHERGVEAGCWKRETR